MEIPLPWFLVLAVIVSVPAVPQALGGLGTSTDDTAGQHLGPGLQATTSSVLEEGLLEGAQGPIPVIVHGEDSRGLDRALATAEEIEILYRFESIPAAYAIVAASELSPLAQQPDTTFIESASKDVEYHLDEATITSRAREVFDPSFDPSLFGIDEDSPNLVDAEGNTINGSGIGIAVVDSGLDATHPGFQVPGKVQANYVMTPRGEAIDAGPYTELGEGHGTRIAGVASGTGAGASENTDLRGAAPGSSLYGFAIEPRNQRGFAGTFDAEKPAATLLAAMAFDWILENGDDQDPAIRVVLNGWSCGETECSDDRQAHLQLAEELAEAGFVVVFPVGNGQGEALVPATSAESTLPTPGIIGVAGYEAEGPADRGQCASGISSQGNAFDPATWPDIAAPSFGLMSPNAMAAHTQPRLPVGSSDEPTDPPTDPRWAYTNGFGTSMGAAHIAGIASLVLQANPSLLAEDVEYILETTAHEGEALTDGGHCPAPFIRADATNPWDGANYEVGHGLVDAMDAVQMAQAYDGLPDGPAPDLEEIPADYLHEDAVVSIDEEQVFYLDGEDELSTDAPEGDVPRVRPKLHGDGVIHRTQIQQETSVSAAYAEVWMGDGDQSTQHTVYCRSVNFQAQVLRIDADTGQSTLLGEAETDAEPMVGPGPWMKEIPIVFGDEHVSADDPVHEPEWVVFEPGDELELRVQTSSFCTLPPSPHPEGDYVVYSEAESTPSRLFLGESTREYEPGSFEACQEIRDNYSDAEPEEDIECSWIGGARQNIPTECVEGRYKVQWEGPPGSGALLECSEASVMCTVPSDVDGWGSCEAEGVANKLRTTAGQQLCTYFTDSGEQVDGEGQCTIVRQPSTSPS